MKSSAALFQIALALGAISLVPWPSAQAQGSREEGPREIDKCQTISTPGSYKLVNNLTGPLDAGANCLVITADFVTIDLAGFLISGGPGGSGIFSPQGGTSIAVRNGSIRGFVNSVNLHGANGSIVEGLRVSGWREGVGIVANGIVKGNIATGSSGGSGPGIAATGTVTGNYVSGATDGFEVGPGSTLIGNTATNNGIGLEVFCPSNLTDNTAVNNNISNLVLNGDGCNDTNKVAP
jgi:hypothetical protein